MTEPESPDPSLAEAAYRQYRRTQIAEMADWHPGLNMVGVSISDADRENGSPKYGDKIARNPANHDDRWLVAAAYFAENFEPLAAAASREEAVERLRAALDEMIESGTPYYLTREAIDALDALSPAPSEAVHDG